MDEIFDNKSTKSITINELEETGPDQIGYTISEEKPKRERAKFYAVIVASDSQFDSVIVADDKKDLQNKITLLERNYSENGMSFSITAIIRGYEVKFKETRAIEFL